MQGTLELTSRETFLPSGRGLIFGRGCRGLSFANVFNAFCVLEYVGAKLTTQQLNYRPHRQKSLGGPGGAGAGCKCSINVGVCG